jgi:hypothetical protein
MTKTSTIVSVLILGVCFAAGGCKGDDDNKPASASGPSEDVTAKSAPANPGDAPQAASGPPPATQAVAAPDGAPSAGGKRDSVEGVSWETPDGWSRGRQAPMRLATLTDGQADIAISASPGNVGGILANVNRWRQQVKLPPVGTEADARKDVREMDVNGRKVEIVDLTGSERTLVAIVPGDGRLYFFKMTAPADVAAKRQAAFEQLVKSIRVE